MNSGDLTSLAPILYGEDDENDVFFMRRAFKKAAVNNPLIIARNGSEAMKGLQCFQEGVSSIRPALVILDLKMPNLSGLDVLRWARKQPGLTDLPLILFTSSTQERDLRESYDAGASAYVVKPSNPDRLVDIVREIQMACLGQTNIPGWLNIPSNLPPPR